MNIKHEGHAQRTVPVMVASDALMHDRCHCGPIMPGSSFQVALAGLAWSRVRLWLQRPEEEIPKRCYIQLALIPKGKKAGILRRG